MMCEFQSNVLLASDFARVFYGFSIGSNDLTLLIRSIDRDSALLAHLFDERDEAVMRMIAKGIDSTSLHPDAVLRTTLDVLALEGHPARA